MKMKRVGFELEYPCHSPRQQRWFIGRVTRFEKLDKTRVVVTHENITGQKLAEMALRESEERFRQLSGGSFEGIIIHDEGKIINANEVFVAMFGYDLPELIGINALEFATPELREIAERHIRTGSEEPYEGVALRMDGSTFDVEVRSKNIPYKGRIVRVTAVVDITERKRIEKALRKNTISLSESQRIGKLGSWDWDIVDNSLSWSDEIYRIWGVGKDFLLNFENIAGMIHPDDRELNSKRIQEFLASQAKGEFEFRIICPDGTVKYIFQSIEVTRAPSGQPIRMFGIMQDITERKKAAKEVALLAHTIRSISECVSITDTEDKILFVNDAFLKTYGYTADELFGKSITVHRSPGSEPAAGKILPATLQGGWQGELVNRKKDGTEFPIALSTSVVSNEKGQPIALVGIATDITERKRAEEEVRESQQLLKGTLSSLLDALFIIDANTVEIIDCNPAASAIFGYTREEMVGKTTTFLHVNQATLDEFRQYLNSAVEEKGFLFLPDYRMRRKDASIFPTEHSVIPILDEKGTRSGWVSMVR
ncbi:MAG: PAS domain S-box protein, partial [Ignavibacteriales bacterium]|nr:PAS domain S-box protein [Ignavibacteriales bacterium]